jgi:hypothetical protein
MPPQQPPTLNPLAAISGPQPAPSTTAIDALRLAGVNQAGQTGRNTATNRAGLIKAGMPHGLNPFGENYGTNLDIRRQQQGALANAQALGAAASGGVRLPKGGLTAPGFDLSGILPNVKSGYPTLGADQAANMPRPTGQVDRTVQTTRNIAERAKAGSGRPPGSIITGKEVITEKVTGKGTKEARRKAGITTPGVNLIPRAEFESGIRLGAGKSPSDAPIGSIIEGPDQRLHPGYYKRGENGEFTSVDIDYGAPAAATTKPAETPVPRPPMGDKKDKDKAIPGIQNIAPGFVGG